MDINWSSISAGAMAAAVSIGSSAQSLGAAAAASLPSVTAGGLQAVTSSASAAVAHVPAVLPHTVQAGAASASQLAQHIAVVEKPTRAMAASIPRSSLLAGTAGFLAKALPIVTIGASALAGAQLVQSQGPQALVNTSEGRGAVLGAVGGTLLLMPTPATQLAAAGVLGAVAVNHFGGMDALDSVRLG